MIPKITHQIFMQGFDALSEDDRQGIIAFRQRNPSWDHRFYDRETAESGLADNCSQDIRDAYYLINPVYHAARSDFLRYLLCQRHGGFYLDVKSEAAFPLDDILQPDDHYLLGQWPELRGRPAGQGNHRELDHVPGDEFVNWFIVASPAHPFLRAIIEKVVKNIANYHVWRDGVGRMGVMRTTGPIAYTQAIYSVLDKFPHRFADMESELGFHYSRFGDYKSHRASYGRHYETIAVPVINRNPVTTQAAKLWFSSLKPEINRSVRRFHKVVNMLPRLRS